MARALLLLLAALALASAQTPVFRIGGTQTSCGNGAEQSAAMKSALLFYANYTNANGGVLINGTRHDLDIVIYNDARDPELVKILYERLIFVDQVHALLSPFANSIPAFDLARSYGIPMVNIFDLAYYSTGAPNGTWGGWVFSAVPNPLTFVDACYDMLRGYGLQTVSSAWPDDISLFALDILNVLATAKATLSLKFPQYSVPNNLTGVSDVVRNLKKDNGDIFSGGMLLVDSLQGLLNEMRLQRYNPQAILFWAGVLFKSFREGAGWQAHRIFGASPWDPTLNFSDAQFGSSQNFARIYESTLGVEPEATTALAIFGAQSLKLAAEKAGSLDREDLRLAMLSLNEETFFGLANYTFPLQQTQGIYYCFQVDDEGTLNPVSANAPDRVRKPVLWPALATEPANFRAKGTSHRKRWVALGVGLGLGLLVLITVALAVIYMWKVKYRVIFIPKASDTGEW